MKNELTQLIALAQIDAEIDALKEEKEYLPRLIDELEGKVRELEETLTHKRSLIESLKGENRKKELEIKEQKDWIGQRETQVKEIKTIKEYQASLKEIAKTKKEIMDSENALLGLMAKLEEETKALAEIESSLNINKESLSKEITDKREQMKMFDAQIQTKIEAKIEKEKEIVESTLKRYRQIKARISPAVSLASRNGVCQECNMNIPPQLFIELQKFQQIITCPRCYRILCWTP